MTYNVKHVTYNKIKIALSDVVEKQYDVVIGGDLADQLVVFFKKQKNIFNIVIITDNNVNKLYGEKLLSNLKTSNQLVFINLLSFSAGEQHKTQKTVTDLQNKMFRLKCGRDTVVIALGGGVVGDVAGYTAATYMRGIPYIQIPTTLLAMVDSSVGGKTGVDTVYGKNLVGAFHQPIAVFVEPKMLLTLSKKHIKNGLIEAIKMFMTHDKEMFDYVRDNYGAILKLDKSVLQKIITRAIEIKARVVIRDEKERGERAILNFGHTIGHAIEKLSNYNLLHGEAVGFGILVESKIAELLGKLSSDVYREIEDILGKMVKVERLKDYKIEDILRETKLDKKARSGEVTYVFLKNIGRFCTRGGKFVHGVDEKIVKKALTYFI